MKDDTQEAAGSLQTTNGLKAGAKEAIHTMRTIFEDPSTEGVILVDTSNPFNSLNWNVVLHNIQIACLSFSHILLNTYRTSARMIIMGDAETRPTEGTAQVGNLAMFFYAIVTVQIQRLLRISVPDVKQVWLTDDATGASSLKSLKNWWANIISEGGCFCFYVNEKKTWHIIKNEVFLENAKNLFSYSKVNIAAERKMRLGAAIGSNEFRIRYVNEKVNDWCEELKTLPNFAKSQPQAAYAAFCFAEQNKYSYFLRTIPSISELMKPVDEIIQNDLLPLIIGGSITENERQLRQQNQGV